MFSLHDFVFKTLEEMKVSLPEFQVRQFALEWFSKGVLESNDLELIESWYAPVVDEPTIIPEI